jgi:hypothetical protein
MKVEPARLELEWAVETRSYPGAPRGGDFGLLRPLDGGWLAALVDATGHGLSAYAIAQKARHALLETPDADLERILWELNEVLAGSEGAAVSVAHLREGELVFAGVGNVAAFVGGRPLLVRTGVVGRQMRTPHPQRVDFGPGTWLLMHTDGISHCSEVPHGSAETAARTLVEERSSSHDDSSVLLARWLEKTP